jgi:beta-galactosidase
LNRTRCLLLVSLLPLTLENYAQKSPMSGAPSSAAVEPRVEISLRDGWRFRLGPESVTELQDEPDATWATVSVPHTWNRAGYYKDAPASHINTAQNVVTTQGVGWYKLIFTPPANVAGMESFLQFDAASRIATVWLNGTLLGTHRGGFSRFRLDSTAALKPGQQNTLTVKVDNTKPALGSSTADVLPLTGDFFVYGGLYRPVSLVFTRKTHLDLMDYGSSGVYAKTTSISSDGARVQVQARVRNDGDQSDSGLLRILLIDAQAKSLHSKSSPSLLDEGAGWRAPRS